MALRHAHWLAGNRIADCAAQAPSRRKRLSHMRSSVVSLTSAVPKRIFLPWRADPTKPVRCVADQETMRAAALDPGQGSLFFEDLVKNWRLYCRSVDCDHLRRMSGRSPKTGHFAITGPKVSDIDTH